MEEKCIICDSIIVQDSSHLTDGEKIIGLLGIPFGPSGKWICRDCIKGLNAVLPIKKLEKEIEKSNKTTHKNMEEFEKKVVKSFNKLRGEIKRSGLDIFGNQSNL